MGCELHQAGKNDTPAFLIQALRDPDGANLDRIQIVKGWVDSEGVSRERIYDVALSGDRAVDASGRSNTPVGNTVDAGAATWRNDIGAASLAAHWVDPDFKPDQRAFYYARVLEIPTPRWTSYDASRIGSQVPPGVPLAIQDRAYTSPVWYSP